MIIYGTRGVTYKHAEGLFYCPGCGPDKPYKHKRVRRFFTLYFIPIIPLDLLGEYIECVQCKDTYKLGVLSLEPGPSMNVEAEFQTAIRRVMVLMMLADGIIEDEEIEAIQQIYQKIADVELTEQQIRAEAREATSTGATVKEYLSGVVGSLNDAGKEMVVKAAFMVAGSDNDFADEEKELLGEIAEALQMSGTQLNNVLTEMLAPE